MPDIQGLQLHIFSLICLREGSSATRGRTQSVAKERIWGGSKVANICTFLQLPPALPVRSAQHAAGLTLPSASICCCLSETEISRDTSNHLKPVNTNGPYFAGIGTAFFEPSTEKALAVPVNRNRVKQVQLGLVQLKCILVPRPLRQICTPVRKDAPLLTTYFIALQKARLRF